MGFSNPTVADFKAFFVRDFPYNTDPSKGVMDQDIANAYAETNQSINPTIWGDQAGYTLGYLLLSAHYLVMNLRASSQGLSGTYSWIQTSKSVGSVSESSQIPERITQTLYFAMMTKTQYGGRYLFLILPKLTGNIVSVCGGTRA